MGSLSSSKTNTSKSKTPAHHGQHRDTARKSAVAAAACAAIADPFNADGVVENPSVAISRELAKHDLIAATLYAHQVAGQWIAGAVWNLTVAPSLGDGTYPARRSARHATQYAAIEAVTDTLIQQVEGKRTVIPPLRAAA